MSQRKIFLFFMLIVLLIIPFQTFADTITTNSISNNSADTVDSGTNIGTNATPDSTKPSSSLASTQNAPTKESSSTTDNGVITPSSSDSSSSDESTTPPPSQDKTSLIVQDVSCNAGSDFSPKQVFVSATDASGNALSADQVQYSGNIDASNPGTYTLTVTNGNLIKTATITVIALAPNINYQAQVQSIGWQSPVSNGALAGTTGRSLRAEALKATLSTTHTGLQGGISYQAYVQNSGWQNEVSNGQQAGTTGKSLRMEAIKIHLTGNIAEQYNVYYRVHVQNIGWMAWAKNGAISGSTGMSLRIEAIEIVLVKNTAPAPFDSKAVSFPYLYQPSVKYQAHIQNIGWQNSVTNGTVSGTVGKALRMEGIRVSLSNVPQGLSGGIQYKAHVQSIGWQSMVSNGATAGTTGKALRIEAISISLTGDISKYFDVYYQTQVQSFGWLDWAHNGGNAGTSAISARMESIKIQLVRKGSAAPGKTTKAYLTNTDASTAYFDYMNNYSQELKGTNRIIESTISHGISLIGKSPYCWGGGRTASSIAGNHFDCSSFTSWMYHLGGKTIDNQAWTNTWSLATKGYSNTWAKIKRGDLIILFRPDDSHVVIYLGDGFFLHDSPSSPTGGVGINRLSDYHPGFKMTWKQVFNYPGTVIRTVS